MLQRSDAIVFVQSNDDLVDMEGTQPEVNTFRKDLCHREQLARYHQSKWNDRLKYLESLNGLVEGVTTHHKKVSILLLVDEAHRLATHNHHRTKQQLAVETPTNLNDDEDPHYQQPLQPTPLSPRITSQWKRIGTSALQEFSTLGHNVVARRLSCMCMFVDGHKRVIEYGEQDVDRTRRQQYQCEVLKTLYEQKAKGVGNGYFVV
eukprot:PhF_6_TR40933/c2_g1_i1/m.61923